MADVLSQSEIDALLNAVAMGEMSADELKKMKKSQSSEIMILNVH